MDLEGEKGRRSLPDGYLDRPIREGLGVEAGPERGVDLYVAVCIDRACWREKGTVVW